MKLLLSFALFCFRSTLSAQISIQIDDATTVQLTMDQLAALPSHKVVLHDHGQAIEFGGPLLSDVLSLAKFEFGTGLHGKALSQYLVAKASDHYEVVFSLAELDSTITNGEVILATRRKDQPLSPKEGPLRLIVSQDKRPARCVRQVIELDVKHLR